MHETQTLARFVAESQWSDIPLQTRHEGKRALLNWLGCALGGCRDETVDRMLAAVSHFSGERTATVVGRREKLDPLNAALVNAVSSNILDFDDTHMKTVIHPTVPLAAAIFAVAEHRPVTGAQLLHAFVLGVEVECRIGNALTSEHYERGWHITATCGVFGAAAAAGKLLGLNETRVTGALGIAATQASGLTEMLGSMSKSYNMGHAAKNGLMAALLAERDFTSSSGALEARRGFLSVTSSQPKPEALTEGLGDTWELAWNAYKPFPCGIVLHAAIDACIELRREYALTPGDVESIEVQLHPLALQLAGRLEPTTGLEGKLSVAHAAAVALLRGQAGVEAFTDACVRDPDVVSLRRRVRATPDAALDKAAALVRIGLIDGRTVERAAAHAIGSLERPMSDGDIETKFRALASRAYSECHTWDMIELVWSLERLNDAAKLVRATAPET